MSARKRPHDKPDAEPRNRNKKSRKRSKNKRSKKLRKLLFKAGEAVRRFVTQLIFLKILLDLWVEYRVALPDDALALVMTSAILSFLIFHGNSEDGGKLLEIVKEFIDLLRS